MATGKKITQVEANKVAQQAGVKPLEPYTNAHAPWRCKCLRCGEVVAPQYKAMRSGHLGCKFCANQLSPAKISIAARAKILAEDLVAEMGFLPQEPYPGKKKSPWKLLHVECGKTSTPTVENLTKALQDGRTGCGSCKKGAILDADTAVALMEEMGFSPLVRFPGANSPWPSTCTTCKKVSDPRLSTVRNKSTGCRWCKRIFLDPSEAVAMMLGYGYEPLEKYPGSVKKWRAVHTLCGHEVFPSLSNLQQGHGGCKFCKTAGFDAGSPAIVYLVSHKTLGAAKVGISKATNDRVNQHTKEGWRIYRQLECRGDIALMLESALLRRWRSDLALEPKLSKRQMPQGGYTETVDLESVKLGTEWRHLIREYEKIDKTTLPELEPRKSKRPKPQGKSLQEKRKERAASYVPVLESLGLKAVEEFPGATTKWGMLCQQCGHNFAAVWQNLKNGHGCPKCGRERSRQARRINENKAIQIMKASGWEPIEPYHLSTSPWRSRCIICGTIGNPTLQGIEKRNPHCRIDDKGNVRTRRSVLDTNPLIASEAHGWDPATVLAGSSKVMAWRCSKGHDYKQKVQYRIKKSLGCPECRTQI